MVQQNRLNHAYHIAGHRSLFFHLMNPMREKYVCCCVAFGEIGVVMLLCVGVVSYC